MKKIVKLISIFSKKEEPKKLGRWKIETCNKKMDNKVDLANEDHCGPCGQYAVTKKYESILLDKNNKIKEKDINKLMLLDKNNVKDKVIKDV